MDGWFRSYANHILHCSLYSCIAAYSFKSVAKTRLSIRDASTSPSWAAWDCSIPLMIGAIAAHALYSEIRYISMRIGLPPGDSGSPFIGHHASLVSGRRIFNMKHIQTFGDPCVRNIFMNPCLYLYNDEDVQWALAQERKGNLTKSATSSVAAELFGKNTITMETAENHKRLRRIFEPSFSPKAIQDYTEKMDDTIKETFKIFSDRNDFCSAKDWKHLTMRVFFVCAFGQVKEDFLIKLYELFETWLAGFSTKLPFRSLPGTSLNKAFAAKKEMSEMFQSMIDDFRARNPAGSPSAETTMMGRMCYSMDDNGKYLSDEQLISNLLFVIFAGYHSTSASFMAFLHFLSGQPKIKDLLIGEMKCFPVDAPLDPVKLKAVPLLNAFLAEVWRLVPPTEGHHMEAATDLEYKNYKIRKGTKVTVDITCDGVMNKSRFPDPLEIRLERWLPEDHPLHNPKYYVEKVDYNVMSVKYRSFGFGVHMCLGGHFAKLESRVFLIRLLQSYDFEIRKDKCYQGFFLQYENEFKLTRQ